MLKKEFEFTLQDELIYSHDGKAGLHAKKLLLRAPTTRHLALASQLSSLIMNALIKARESFKSDADERAESKKSSQSDLDGDGIYMLISGSLDVKQTEKLINLFSELMLARDICLIDGREQMTDDLFETLDSRETLRLLGDYIANFLLPSIMNQSKRKT